MTVTRRRAARRKDTEQLKRWSWLRSALGATLLHLWFVAPAAAQAPGADAAQALGAAWLDWESPEGCPDRAAVYARAREAAGFAPELGRFERVRGVVLKQPGGFVLTLQFFEARAQSSRSIEARDCSDLQGAAAVAIALALGNQLPSPPQATIEAGREPASDAGEAPPLARGVGWSWALGGLFDLGSVAHPSFGLGATARVRLAALELGLSGLWIPESQREVRPGESVRFGLVAAGPVACWRWQVLLEPAACASVEVGQLSADGAGLSQNQHRFSPWWLAPSLAVELRQRLAGLWGLQLRAEALRPLSRQRYTVNDSESVYESPEAVLRLYMGVSGALD